jgi:beta-glucosidase
MTDGDVPDGLKGKEYSFRLSGILKPEVTGTHQVGISSVGKSKLYLNGTFVLDNTDWTEKGETFMICGSKEYRLTVNLDSSKFYEVRLEQASTPPSWETS